MARRSDRRSEGGDIGGGASGRRKRQRPPPPSPETVVSEGAVVSPKGRVYRILRTNQTDPYDPATAAGAKPKQ